MKNQKTLSFIAVLTMAMIIFGGCKKQQELQTPQSESLSSSKTDLVLVPRVGLVPKSQVHIVEAGAHLTLQGTHILKVQNVSGKTIEDFGPIHIENSPNSPTGMRNLSQRNLSVSPGNIVGANPNWITWSSWTNPSNQPPINYFTTTWKVPNAPTTNHGQTLFIFNGLQTASGSDILQPVLQWGPSAAGGGAYWAVANWFVSSGFYAVQMPLISVNSQATLQGVMTYTGQQAGTGSYNYTSAFVGYNNQLNLVDGSTINMSNGTTPYIPLQPGADETLEAYSSTGDVPQYSTDYPPDADVRMTNIQITTSNGNSSLNWVPQNNVTNFGQQTIVASQSSPGGEVDIYFRTPPPASPIAEIDISKGDTCYYWYKSGKVSAGTSSNSVQYMAPVNYTLPAGKTPDNIVGIAFSHTNWCYYWYNDGTMSVGTYTNATAYIAPKSYALPAGETPSNILSMSIAKSNDYVYTWFKDGTAVTGNSTTLAAYRSAYPYTVAAGQSIGTVVGIGIAGSNDHTYAWYYNGSGLVSSGATSQFDYYFGAIPSSF